MNIAGSLRSSSGTTIVDRHQDHQTLESCFTGSSWIDPFKLEAFEYQELTDVTKEITRTFDHLIKISPLWLDIENNKVGCRTSFSREADRDGGRMMFGDWRLDDPLVDVFEGESDTVRSERQVSLCYTYSSFTHNELSVCVNYMIVVI